MNPPFTRPTNHEGGHAEIPIPSFAGFGTSASEQKSMSQQLKSINAKIKGIRAGNGNAGLASNFFDLAHKKLREGGVLALVLPFTFVQGASWLNARRLLNTYYKEITILSISSSEKYGRAFSADTKMAEVLVVATKMTAAEVNASANADALVEYVNLRARPRSILEGYVISKYIREGRDSAHFNRIGGTLSTGGCAALASRRTLARTMISLNDNQQLLLPRTSTVSRLPLVALRELGQKGVLSRDIIGAEISSGGLPRGPFQKTEITRNHCTLEYPALWNHAANRERSMEVDPDSELIVRVHDDDRAAVLWETFASRLHINVDFQLNSQSLGACITKSASLGGRAWPNYLLHESSWEIPIVLWYNTTLGLMTFWWLGTRQQIGRACVKQTIHPDLLSIDPRALTKKQHQALTQIYQEFKNQKFLPANEAYRDNARMSLDDSVFKAFGLREEQLDSIKILREIWCNEPSVHGGQETRPTNNTSNRLP